MSRPPSSFIGVVHLLSCTRARTIPDTVCGAPSGHLPLPGNRLGCGRGRSVRLGKRTARRKHRRAEPFPEAQCPVGLHGQRGPTDAERTSPGRHPLLLVREQVKAESADLTVQTLSVAQGVGLLVRGGGGGG